jgi:hypothetical protein
MKYFRIKLLIIAIIMCTASSAFASFSYNVSVNTTSLEGLDGYLYFAYGGFNAVDSTASLYNFKTDGQLSSARSTYVVDGRAVTGALPSSIVFANTNGANDYNHGIYFGKYINFNVTLAAPVFGGQAGGNSTFSLSLYRDEAGFTPLLGGTQINLELLNNGTSTAQVLTTNTTVTPIPAAAWLLGSGLLGLTGLRRKRQI